MKRTKKISIIGLGLVLAILAGCNKQEVQSSGAEAAPNQVKPKHEQKAVEAAAPDLAAYYARNLEEARTERHKCMKLTQAEITPEVEAKCSAAQVAWEMQPYKPKGK